MDVIMAKEVKLAPGAYIGRECSVCHWPLHVYFMSRTYTPGEPIPAPEAIPMWWQTVCLCGHRDYEPLIELEQMSLLEMMI